MKLMLSCKSDSQWVQLVSSIASSFYLDELARYPKGRTFHSTSNPEKQTRKQFHFLLLSWMSHSAEQTKARSKRIQSILSPISDSDRKIHLHSCRLSSRVLSSFIFCFFFFSANICLLVCCCRIMGSVTDGNWIKLGDPWRARLSEAHSTASTHPTLCFMPIVLSILKSFPICFFPWISINVFEAIRGDFSASHGKLNKQQKGSATMLITAHQQIHWSEIIIHITHRIISKQNLECQLMLRRGEKKS